ncbi:retropepsin-like aspartic protease family protein [Tropicibacter oceani]|uniref:TIGR02281 family clan AA aspartic protease n=1 Tax=Tropicibacter oceani TaxID=3058420 RepID=A0ABY8QCZ6_9RHOB|nr:TIGR02281 family clan AA aspartic protease [Tropicibacter oceani]WGW02494.1 TIGR02281 family clan AA aspartic protease [Tropicibacter oceani]
MSSWETGQFIYLLVLGGALALWLFIENRDSIGTKLKQLSAWGLIFLGTIAVIGLWGDIRQTVQPRQAVFADQGRIELPMAPDGHYYVTLQLNGEPIRFVVDTGASAVVLTRQDAARAGIDAEKLAFFSEAMTANGAVKTAPVTLDMVALGPFEDRKMPAFVNAGEMDTSLLGMTYLQRFDRIEISGGQLVLER